MVAPKVISSCGISAYHIPLRHRSLTNTRRKNENVFSSSEREAADICRQNRVMTDEIQSGLGRTGKLFAYMHEGVTPDVILKGN